MISYVHAILKIPSFKNYSQSEISTFWSLFDIVSVQFLLFAKNLFSVWQIILCWSQNLFSILKLLILLRALGIMCSRWSLGINSCNKCLLKPLQKFCYIERLYYHCKKILSQVIFLKILFYLTFLYTKKIIVSKNIWYNKKFDHELVSLLHPTLTKWCPLKLCEYNNVVIDMLLINFCCSFSSDK